MGHIVWFSDCHPHDTGAVGGKNASLAAMVRAGLPVPPGFAVPADVYRKALADSGLAGEIESIAAAADPADSASVSRAGSAARAAVSAMPPPGGLADAVGEAYEQLCRMAGISDVPVAVRSSATCEDQPDASFAGEHDTYLWVRGCEAVLTHVLRCWASLFTDRALCYRQQMGYATAAAAMSVGIQKMVQPRAAGVAFTLNPVNGDRSQVAIDASWGFGEAVVSGEVTPDNYLVDKVMGQVTHRTVSAKALEYRLAADGTVRPQEVPEERQQAPCLTDAEILAVAAMARRAEKHFGCPQDVEWALDGEAGRGGQRGAAAKPPGNGLEPPLAGHQVGRVRLDQQHRRDVA